MLEAELRLRRPGFTLDAALTVGPGEIVVVYGPSGAGKTTIVRAIAGLHRPASGVVRCGEQTWFASGHGRSRVDLRPQQRPVGLVVQEGALFPHLSAWRNVAFALHGVPRGERRRQSVAALERLGLGVRVQARPGRLSGGERQRVALARALARRPDALLLDEPFAALDRDSGDRAAALVREVVRDRRVPAVVVSHDPTDVARLGGRALVVQDGRLVAAPAGAADPALARATTGG